MFRQLQDNIKTLSALEITETIKQKPHFRFCAAGLLIEYGRIHVLKNCIKACTYQNVLESIYYRRFNATEYLLKMYNDYDKPNLASILVKLLMTHIVKNGADNNIHILQSVFLYIIENNLHSLLTPDEYVFVKGMADIYKRRVEKAKKTIYYGIINVICNPNHKIGYRLVLKEYNEMMLLNHNLQNEA